MIAKADTLTADEVSHFKRQIMNQIVQSDIRVYEFPDGDGDGDGDGDAADEAERRSMRDRVPFAVVGSNMLIDGEDGKKVRGRRYPWGVVNVSQRDRDSFLLSVEKLNISNTNIFLNCAINFKMVTTNIMQVIYA